MISLDDVYQMVADREIHIYERHFSKTKKAACMKADGYKAIILDKPALCNSYEEKTLLAEECGHYETQGFYMIDEQYNAPLARANRIKAEGAAKRWAVRTVVPINELLIKVYSGKMPWEIAEDLEITEDIVHEAYEVYGLA